MQRTQPTYLAPALLAAWLLLALAPAAWGQFRGLGLEAEPLVEPRFELIDNASRAHLDRVPQLLADDQLDEAVEILRRVMETDGDRLMPVPEYADGRKTPFVRYYPVRHVCHRHLASLAHLSPAALDLYRSRVDRTAERWLDEGRKARDPALVARVIREFFASSAGDDALWLLGEMALSQGEYTTARNCWERLHPATRTPSTVHPSWPVPPGRPLWLALKDVPLDEHWPKIEPALTAPAERTNWLCYPDTEIPLADIRARLTLVSIMEGNRQRAATELELMRRLHGDAIGRIGGREGRYVDLLTSLLEQSAAWPSPAQAGTWPTFAGAPSRTRVAPDALAPDDKELWHINLQTITSDRETIGSGRPRVGEEHRGLLSYHPVVWNDIVLLAEHTQIRALRLSDGRPAWPGGNGDGVIYRFGVEPAGDEESEYPVTEPHPRSRPYVGAARMTLTVHGDKLFARMGSRLTVSAQPNPADAEKQGIIVGLDLAAQGRMLRGFPLRPEGPEWNFEGTPVSDGIGLYVAMRKHDQVNSQAHVACYDLATGQLRWRRWVCSASTPGRGMRDEISHALLTLAEGDLYYNTNLGAVAKISTREGSLQWAVQYPRGAFPNQDPDRRDRHFFRDLTPCVFFQGMVIAAPSDSDRIFALDAATGQLVWTTPVETGSDVVHLLGVSQNQLLASGDYLYWFDVFTGQQQGQFPPPQKDAPGFALPSPHGFGRGLLADGWVYWPTRERIHIFRPETKRTPSGREPVAAPPIDLSDREARGGNLVLAGQTLLIAGAKKLQAFRNLPPRSNDQGAAQP